MKKSLSDYRRLFCRLLFISLLIGCAGQTNAQFRWGTRTGLQISTLHSNKVNDFVNSKLSFLVPGFYFEHSVSERLKLSIDIQYTNKGFISNGFINNEAKSIRHPLQYLSFPIAIEYSFNKTLSVFAGPEISRLLSSHFIVNNETVSNDFFKMPWDFGIKGGVSLQLSPDYRLAVSYIHGLRNTINPELTGGIGNVIPSDLKMTNRSFQLSLSTAFSIPQNQRNSFASFSLRQGIVNSNIVGTGVYNLTNGEESESAPVLGYEAGLEAKIGIQKYFFINTGLLYSQIGGKFPDDQRIRMDILSVPVLFGVSPILEKEITLSIEGGVILNTAIKTNNPYEEDFSYAIKHNNSASFMYGFELEAPIKEKMSFFFSYRNALYPSRFLEWEDGELEFNRESFTVGLRLKTNERKKVDRETAFDNRSSIGFKGGFSFNVLQYKNQTASTASGSELKLGGLAGMYFKIRLGQRVAFIPEIQYSATPFFKSFDNPLMVSFALDKKSSIEGGVRWSIIGSQEVEVNDDYIIQTGRPVDFGWDLGLKYAINSKVSIGTRYHHGLADIISWYDSQGLHLDGNGFNRNVQIAAYYSF